MSKRESAGEVCVDLIEAGNNELEGKEVGGKWQPVHESALINQVVRLVHLNYKNVEIAGILGITPQTVSNIRTSNMGKRKLEIFKAAADEKTMQMSQEILNRAPVALDILDDILLDDDVSSSLKASIARDILDRAGHGAVKKSENKSLNFHRYLTNEDIERINQRGRELAEENGLIVNL